MVAILAAVILPTGVVAAAGSKTGSSSNSSSNDISSVAPQSYGADASVLPGMIVEAKTKDQTAVTPATAQDVRKMLGVVVPSGAAAITLTPPTTSSQQVLVASSGRYSMLVSSQDGPISSGDYLTISALSGIGMKAGSSQPVVIGRAAGSFDGKSNVIDTTKLNNSLGGTTVVSIGTVPVDIHVAANPLSGNGSGASSFLVKLANSITNKKVNPVRVYLSVGVLLATFVITGSILYGGIRGGMTAIGRNPLAKGAINRGLLQSVIMGLIVFVAGFLAIYAILI